MDTTDPSRRLKPEDGDRSRWLVSLPGFASENSAQDNISLSEIYGAIRRRYPVILACIMVITIFCTAVVFQLTPLYTAESELLIDQHKMKTPILDLQSAVSGLTSDATAIQSEVDVLQSADIAGAVVKKANLLEVPEFNPWLRRDSGLGIILKPFYWAVSGAKSLFASRSVGQQDDADRAELFSVIRALQARTDIVNDGKSYVLKIYVESEDPKLAAELADAYADAYLDAQLEAKFAASQRASSWLSDHLTDLRTKAESADQAVQQFAAANNLTQTTSSTSNVTSQQISELNTQLVLASADLAQKQAALQQVKNSVHTGGISATAQVQSSPLIQNLREQESMLLTQQANLATRYRPDHPAMINIAAQIHDLNQKISDETNRIIHGMEGDVVAAQAKVDSLRQSENDLQSAPQNDAQVQLHELQREADADRTIYEGFLNRYKQTSAQEDIPEPDARIVAHAMVPTGPSFPKKLSLIFMAFIGSSMIGVFAAIGMELLDVGFRTGDQVEKITQAPMLGIEPALHSSESPQDAVVQRPLSSYAVSLQAIRTALRYSDVDNPPKVVLVTSSMSDEGKTVFASSLALSAAKSGIKTLLIDCDLRRPSIAKLFHVEPKLDVLAFFDGVTDKSKIINVDAESGLHFITAPSDTPNPQDLLGSKYMRALIDAMREHYDFIVLDSPPLLAVPDAVALSHAVDGTIFLVRWAKTPRKVVREALKSIHTLGGKLAGVVLSRVDMRKYSTYGYSDPDYYYDYSGTRKRNGG
jgi:exopolysaccharide transport family protein